MTAFTAMRRRCSCAEGDRDRASIFSMQYL
jgi:hypothetical protein